MSPFTITAVDFGRGQAETKILGIIVGGDECNFSERGEGAFLWSEVADKKIESLSAEENMNLCPLHLKRTGWTLLHLQRRNRSCSCYL